MKCIRHRIVPHMQNFDIHLNHFSTDEWIYIGLQTEFLCGVCRRRLSNPRRCSPSTNIIYAQQWPQQQQSILHRYCCQAIERTLPRTPSHRHSQTIAPLQWIVNCCINKRKIEGVCFVWNACADANCMISSVHCTKSRYSRLQKVVPVDNRISPV